MNQNNTAFSNNIPVVTKNLLIINIIVWLCQIVAKSKFNVDLADYLGLHYWESDKFNIAQHVTHLFLHDTTSITHLFFNMFAVFMFGRILETVWGAKRYLFYYLFAGIGAGIIQELAIVFDLKEVIFNPEISQVQISETMTVTRQQLFNMLPVTIGASGAVFGLLLAFGVLFPNVELFLMFIPIPIKAKYFVVGYGLMELFLGIRNSPTDNVAHFAHLGGLLFGLILILYWKHQNKKNGRLY